MRGLVALLIGVAAQGDDESSKCGGDIRFNRAFTGTFLEWHWEAMKSVRRDLQTEADCRNACYDSEMLGGCVMYSWFLRSRQPDTEKLGNDRVCVHILGMDCHAHAAVEHLVPVEERQPIFGTNKYDDPYIITEDGWTDDIVCGLTDKCCGVPVLLQAAPYGNDFCQKVIGPLKTKDRIAQHNNRRRMADRNTGSPEMHNTIGCPEYGFYETEGLLTAKPEYGSTAMSSMWACYELCFNGNTAAPQQLRYFYWFSLGGAYAYNTKTKECNCYTNGNLQMDDIASKDWKMCIKMLTPGMREGHFFPGLVLGDGAADDALTSGINPEDRSAMDIPGMYEREMALFAAGGEFDRCADGYWFSHMGEFKEIIPKGWTSTGVAESETECPVWCEGLSYTADIVPTASGQLTFAENGGAYTWDWTGNICSCYMDYMLSEDARYPTTMACIKNGVKKGKVKIPDEYEDPLVCTNTSYFPYCLHHCEQQDWKQLPYCRCRQWYYAAGNAQICEPTSEGDSSYCFKWYFYLGTVEKQCMMYKCVDEAELDVSVDWWCFGDSQLDTQNFVEAAPAYDPEQAERAQPFDFATGIALLTSVLVFVM